MYVQDHKLIEGLHLGGCQIVDNLLGDDRSEEARCRCRFDHRRHTGKPIDRHFFQHAPYWEIVGVNMYRYTFLWC